MTAFWMRKIVVSDAWGTKSNIKTVVPDAGGTKNTIKTVVPDAWGAKNTIKTVVLSFAKLSTACLLCQAFCNASY